MARLTSYIALAGLLAAWVTTVCAHSFLSCVHRAADGTCLGWPRGFSYYDSDSTGYTHRLGQDPRESGPIKPRLRSGDYSQQYSEKYPMAVARPGQQLTLQWGAFNHGPPTPFSSRSDRTPPTQVYMRQLRNPTSDATLQEYMAQPLLATLDYKHCGMSSNTQDLMCAGAFRIPSGLQDGVYTFFWRWQFNNAQEVYANGFEVYITGNPATATQSFMKRAGWGLDDPNTTIDNYPSGQYAKADGTSKFPGVAIAQIERGNGFAVVSSTEAAPAVTISVPGSRAHPPTSHMGTPVATGASASHTYSPTPVPTFSPTHVATYTARFTGGRSSAISPIHVPTVTPVHVPTVTPIHVPTVSPVHVPTVTPIHVPTVTPVHVPTGSPTHVFTYSPTHVPTYSPTHVPTYSPTHVPTYSPTNVPTATIVSDQDIDSDDCIEFVPMRKDRWRRA